MKRFFRPVLLALLPLLILCFGSVLTVSAMNNQTHYVRSDGYYYINVFQRDNFSGERQISGYTVSTSLSNASNIGNENGEMWIPSTITLNWGTNSLFLTGTPYTISDTASGWNPWDRQYVFCYPFNQYLRDGGFQVGYVTAVSGEQAWLQFPGTCDVLFMTDTNELGITNWIHDGQFWHAVYDLWIIPRTYTLNFNVNNPSTVQDVSIDRMSQTAEYTYPWGGLPTPSKPGYTFKGWFTAGGTQITGDTLCYGQSIIDNGGETVYAHWERNTYTCYFNGNGGTVTASSRPVIYDTGNWNMGASSAYRTGYTFLGYYTDPTNGIMVYDANGNAVNSPGYWSGSGTTATWKRVGDATLYAHWRANPYTISFQKNNPNSDNDVSLSKTSQTSYYDSAWGTLPSPTKPGYNFSGWYTAASGGSQVTNATICKGDLTVYAHWTPKRYTLYFNGNNPNGVNDINLQRPSQTTNYDSAWGTLPTVSKPGYRFLGWFNSPSGGTRFTKDTVCHGPSVINNNGATAYAHWEPIEYTIQFLKNTEHAGEDPNVTGSMGTMVIKYDEYKKLLKNAYEKTTSVPSEDEGGSNIRKESVFKGWSTSPSTITPTFADEAQIHNLTTTDGGVIKLYAIWDDAPKFTVLEYPDRYFTLEEAQNGVITPEELLRTVTVYDRENNVLPKLPGGGDGPGVTVVNYDSEEFTGLTDDGSVLVRYKVKDTSNTEVFLNIFVHVSRNGSFDTDAVDYLRSISDIYVNEDAGNGGLAEDSYWHTGDHKDALDKALSGDTPAYDIKLTKSELEAIRDYINNKGLGNSENDNALREFWDTLGITK